MTKPEQNPAYRPAATKRDAFASLPPRGKELLEHPAEAGRERGLDQFGGYLILKTLSSIGTSTSTLV